MVPDSNKVKASVHPLSLPLLSLQKSTNLLQTDNLLNNEQNNVQYTENSNIYLIKTKKGGENNVSVSAIIQLNPCTLTVRNSNAVFTFSTRPFVWHSIKHGSQTSQFPSSCRSVHNTTKLLYTVFSLIFLSLSVNKSPKKVNDKCQEKRKLTKITVEMK